MKAIGCCGVIIIGYLLGFTEEKEAKSEETDEGKEYLEIFRAP